MLPTQPQSIMNIFFNGIKTYKKIFIPMLPITAIWAAIQVIGPLYVTNQPWLALVSALLLNFLSFFCFCWGICFIYDIVEKQLTSYQVSLKIIAARFFRVLVYPISIAILAGLGWMLFAFVIPSGAGGAEGFWLSLVAKFGKTPLVIILNLLLFLLIFYVLSFGIVYILEILIKNASVFLAMKKAAKVFFKIAVMWRMLCFFIIIVLAVLVFFIPFIVLGVLSASGVHLASANAFLVILNFFSAMLYFPLQQVMLIYFYHDLDLRFENRV